MEVDTLSGKSVQSTDFTQANCHCVVIEKGVVIEANGISHTNPGAAN